MANPLLKLQNLLNPSQEMNGDVVSIAGSKIRVSTSKGLQELPNPGNVCDGDAVQIRDVVELKTQLDADVPVYFV